MDLKRDPDTSEDVVMENTYPSPNADEANYYANAAAQRNADLESQTGHTTSHSGHDAAGVQDASQHELQQLQREMQDEAQAHHDTSVDLAELQLAAQLTQGLAAQNQARQVVDMDEARVDQPTQDVQDSHESHAHQPPDHVEQSLHVQDDIPVVQDALQNHETGQEHDLQEQIQAQLQNQQQHELHSAMSHSMQPGQHHQYLPHPGGHPSAMPNLGMHPLGPSAYGASPDGIPPRKRSKVSRACDECRRKKIKCDAVSETGEQSCSNCRRSSVTCLFSRIPQKRGPSKGYIKELADRIFTIEGRLGGGGDGSTDNARRSSVEEFPSPAVGEKRHFSSISGDNLTAVSTPSKPSTWAEHRPIQPYQPPTPRPLMSVNDLTPRAILPASIEPGIRSADLIDGLTDTPVGPGRDMDDDAFQLYLTTVHPVYPIFATSMARVQSILSQCPSPLREAWLEAFQDLIQLFQSPTGTVKQGSRAAVRLLAEWEAVEAPPDKVTDLVSLQVLLMMAIRDSLISPAATAQYAVAARKPALSRAISLGFSMSMYAALPDPVPGPEFDPNSDENVSLRAWWTVFLLDRWDAIGKGSFMMIPEESTNLVPGLKPVLGTAGYALAELSEFFGDFVAFLKKMPSDPAFDRRQLKAYNHMTSAVFKLFKQHLPPDATESTHPLHYLVYWHVRILSLLSSPDLHPKALLEACKGSTVLLTSAGEAGVLSPLNHHFASLTVMVLLELSKVEDSREDALNLLKEIADSHLPPSSFEGLVKDKVLERLRPTTTGSINSQTLQQLADLATAADGTKDAGEAPDAPETSVADREPGQTNDKGISGHYEALGFDPRPLLTAGYLNYFDSNGNDE